MTDKELLQRHYIERKMLNILLTKELDEETLNLFLDRLIEVKRIIKQLETDINNDKIE